ncbi:MAG: ArsA family ATPase, partial [Vicinamibacteria bacterium]
AGTGVVFSVLKRLTGVDLLDDLSVFFRALGGLIDGFRERAAGVRRLLADPATTFLVVASPEREPVAEAIFFRRKLREARMPFGGLIVNRVTVLDDDGHGDPDAVRAELAPRLGEALAAKVAHSAADLRLLAARDAEAVRRLRRELDEPDPIVVPRLDGEVQDVEGLLSLYRHLGGG